MALGGSRGGVRQLSDRGRAGDERGTNEVLAAAGTQWEFLRDGRGEIERIYDRGEEVFVLARLSRLMPEGDTGSMIESLLPG